MAVPPPFVSNEDPERVNDTQTAMITGVITSVHFIAVVFVLTRSYIRLIILKSPGLQDALMGVAVVSPLQRIHLLDNQSLGTEEGYQGSQLTIIHRSQH